MKDILMGETWLCSGQSNMEYCFKWRVDDITDRSTLFDNKKIRFFKVAKSSSAYPVERIQGKWEICSPETAEDFSVVAFCFGKKLNEGLGNLPVGLIGSYWGGTAIEPWIDEFTLRHEKLEEKTKALTAGWAPTANSSLYNAMIKYMATLVDSPIQTEKGTLYKRSSRNCNEENATSLPRNRLITMPICWPIRTRQCVL